MAYRIISRDFSHTAESFTSESIAPALCDIICDTVAGLPSAADIEKEKILSGSWAWITNANTYAVLSVGGEWHYEI